MERIERRDELPKRLRRKRRARKEKKLEATRAKRQAYYDKCLMQAKKDIVPWSIPDDPNGSLQRKLRRSYNECMENMLQPGLRSFFRSGDEDSAIAFLASVIIPMLLILAILRLFNLDTVQMAIVCVLLYTVHSTIFFIWQRLSAKGYKRRLKKAAECKAVCDVLEARVYK